MDLTSTSFASINSLGALSDTPAISSVPTFSGHNEEVLSAEQVARLFDTLRPDLVRFACWLARDFSIAEDIVQETLLRRGAPEARCETLAQCAHGC